MKIWVIGDRKTEKNVLSNKKIVSILEKNNFVVDKMLVNATHQDDYAMFEDAYKRNMKSLKNCDVVVAEISCISSGIGFLLAEALNQKKPVIALFNSKLQVKPSLTLKGIRSKIFFYLEYTHDKLEKILLKALLEIKQKLDTKFILIISPEIDRYLTWSADYRRMHKAQVVRNAIEKIMETDKEWLKYKEEL